MTLNNSIIHNLNVQTHQHNDRTLVVSDFYIHSDTHPNRHLLYDDTVSDSLRKYVNIHFVGARFKLVFKVVNLISILLFVFRRILICFFFFQ